MHLIEHIGMDEIEMKMKALFVGSEVQQMTRILRGLKRIGCVAAMYKRSIEEIGKNMEYAQELFKYLEDVRPDFVISNLFDGVLATVTHILQIKYAVYGMDSPMYDTYRWEEARFENCHLFYFDKREYERLMAKGYTNVYYMPLAADVHTADELVISEEEVEKYKCDISFVASVYSRNAYDRYVDGFAPQLRELISVVLEQSALQWDGNDRLTPQLTPEVVGLLKAMVPLIDERTEKYMSDVEYIKFALLGKKLTNIERLLLSELLSERYDFRLYTWNVDVTPDHIRRYPQVNFEERMKIFYSSKINLNVTLRSIESGVPARIFDVMSAGGFAFSNWQPEIPELFEEGKEIVTFRTPEEMLDKADYYLHHEEERQRIALNGYRKVKECYTFEHQLNKIIAILYPTP